MKNGLFFLFLCFAFCFAQNSNDIGKIALSVVVDKDAEINDSQRAKIEAKITQIVAGAGLAASGYDQSFLIFPKLSIHQVDVVETGMQNLTKVTAELTLSIKQALNNVVFASVSKQIVGTGKTKAEAIGNAIGKMPSKDGELTAFIESGKQKIIQYYEQKCDDIILKSDALVKQQEYEEAMFLLLSVPEEVSSCYQKVIPKTIAAFDAYQSKICEEHMQKAKTMFAAKNYLGALDVLAKINPVASCFVDANSFIVVIINQQCAEQLQIAKARAGGNDYSGALQALESVNPRADCYGEAKTLLSSISSKIAAAEKQAWDFKMQQYNDAKAKEQRDFEAMQEAKKQEQESKMANKQLASEGIAAAKEVVSGFLNRNKK